MAIMTNRSGSPITARTPERPRTPERMRTSDEAVAPSGDAPGAAHPAPAAAPPRAAATPSPASAAEDSLSVAPRTGLFEATGAAPGVPAVAPSAIGRSGLATTAPAPGPLADAAPGPAPAATGPASAPATGPASAPATGPASAPATGPATGIDGWKGPLDPKIEWDHTPHAGPRKTWWPMFSWGLPVVGNKNQNQWAWGGCLDKLDQLTGGKAQSYQRKERYRSEADAVGTILGEHEHWDTFNAGHCNQEAMRGAFFPDPEHPVVRALPEDGWLRSRFFGLHNVPGLRGAAHLMSRMANAVLPKILTQRSTIEFTSRDICGLMVLCMDDLVDQTRGNRGFDYVGYRYDPPETPDPARDLKPWHDENDPYPHDVIELVCKRWGQGENVAVIADTYPGQKLNNRVFDGGQVVHLADPPVDFDPSAVPAGGEVKFYHIRMIAHAQPEDNLDMDCWVHTAPDGKKTSNWIQNPNRGIAETLVRDLGEVAHLVPHRTPNADFYWRAHLKPEVAKGGPWTGFADNLNPEVDMFQVWTLYKDSRDEPWMGLALADPKRMREHIAEAQRRGRGEQYTELLAALDRVDPPRA